MRNELCRDHCSSIKTYDRIYKDTADSRPDLSDMMRPSRRKPKKKHRQ